MMETLVGVFIALPPFVTKLPPGTPGAYSAIAHQLLGLRSVFLIQVNSSSETVMSFIYFVLYSFMQL